MGAYSDRVVADAASNYWRLGESAGPTAVDSIGGANGTIVGGVTLNQVGPLADGSKAMTFNGTTGYINIGNVAALALTGAFSVEAWVKGVVAAGWMIGKYDSITGAGGWGLQFTTGHVVFVCDSSVGSIFSLPGTNFDTAWHHIVATWSGTTAANGVKTYRDGVLDTQAAAAAGTPAVNAFRCLIGAGDLNPGQVSYLNGSLGEIAIYKRALTGAEITAHYALRTATTGPIFDGDLPLVARRWVTVTPSDTVELPVLTEQLYVGGAGDITIVGVDGIAFVVKNANGCQTLPFAAKQIRSSGTTATDIVALWE